MRILLGLNTRDIDDPDFGAGFKDRLDAQMHKGRFRFEGRHRTKDGRIIPVDINTSAVTLQGQPAILAVMRDITQQKLTENTLAAQYAVARALGETDSLVASGRQILQVLCEGLGLDLGVLCIVNTSQKSLTCLETWHTPNLSFPRFVEATRKISLDQDRDVPGERSGHAVPISLAFDDPNADLPVRCSLAKGAGLKASHAFPIQGSAGIAGVIEFLSRSIIKPAADLLSMMEAIGSQIGQVLERQAGIEDISSADSSCSINLLCNPCRRTFSAKTAAAGSPSPTNTIAPRSNVPWKSLLGKTDFDLFPEALAAKYVEDDRKVLEKTKPLKPWRPIICRKGAPIYVQVVKTPVYDSQGNIIGIQGIFWDVTGAANAEEIPGRIGPPLPPAHRSHPRRHRAHRRDGNHSFVQPRRRAHVRLSRPSR